MNSGLQPDEGQEKRSEDNDEGHLKDDVVIITGERKNCLEAKAALMVRMMRPWTIRVMRDALVKMAVVELIPYVTLWL